LALGRAKKRACAERVPRPSTLEIRSWRPVICYMDTGSQNGNSGLVLIGQSASSVFGASGSGGVMR
jgi:hypothetical protein